MDIGIPREIKDGEARVGTIPEVVRALTASGHLVVVETQAGARVGYPDQAYRDAGAVVAPRADSVYDCPLVIKVKELQREEYPMVRPGTIVAGYHQLGRDPRLLDAVLEKRISCIAYESVTSADGSRPLLAPMSRIAGTLSAQLAAWAIQHREGPCSGSGILLGGMDGGPGANVLILGDGTVGRAAVAAFLAQGCSVTLLGHDQERLDEINRIMGQQRPGALVTALNSTENLTQAIAAADVLVGAIAVAGKQAPKLVTRAMLASMAPGSVFIDVGIDMGGISETSRQTKLSSPLYVEEGVLHYCAANIPALVPRAATQALAAATQPFLQLLADQGLDQAIQASSELFRGLLVRDGRVVDRSLAEDTGRVWAP
jgi:alanine dehydrogenase